MSAGKHMDGMVLPLCEADRCHECPGVTALGDLCTCNCHLEGMEYFEPTDEELEAMRKTLEYRDGHS